MPPAHSRTVHHSGIAVSSWLFAATATWPNTRPVSVAHALTQCNGLRPIARSKRCREVLPSTAMPWLPSCPPVCSRTPSSQPRMQVRNASGVNRAHTRAHVSCDGRPWGRARKRVHQAYCARPYSARSTQVSAPHITAHTAMTTISSHRCLFVRSIRGSGRRAKGSTSEPSLGCSMVVRLTSAHVTEDGTRTLAFLAPQKLR